MWIYLVKLTIAIPVLGIGFWVLMKWVQHNPLFTPKDTKLSIKECLRVSPKATLQVVQVGDQFLLLSVTDQQVTVLKEMTAEESIHWSTSVTPEQESLRLMRSMKDSFRDFETLNEWKVKCFKKLKKK